MSSVTFDPTVGGDGTTVTDDRNPVTGLRGGGYLTRLVPMHAQGVEVAKGAQNWAGALGVLLYGTGYSAKEWAIGSTAPQGTAKGWATVTGALVGSADYSAKEWAQGSFVPAGSAKRWATLTGQSLAADYSAKEWATGVFVPSGSSKRWAIVTGELVDGVEYSAKEYAAGLVVPAGSAKAWAVRTGIALDGEYSAKEYAVGSLVPVGSAKEWATQTGSLVDGNEYSAKEWAIGAEVPLGSAKFWAGVAVNSTNYVGPYSPIATYTLGQIVDADGKFYVLRVPTATGIAPTDEATWLPVGGSGATYYSYEDRGLLRMEDGPDNAQAVVDGLGLFLWMAGPSVDDDETAFVSATGAWLMQATHPDVVFAHQMAEEEDQNARLEDTEARLSSAETRLSSSETRLTAAEAAQTTANSRIASGMVGLIGQVTSTVTSIATTSVVDFSTTVTGAALGDVVVATPRNALGTAAADQSRLHLVGYVSAPNTVVVSIRNASAAAATLTNPTLIDIRVLKGA